MIAVIQIVSHPGSHRNPVADETGVSVNVNEWNARGFGEFIRIVHHGLLLPIR